MARAAAPVRLTGTEAAPLLRGWLQLGGLCGSLPAALAIAQRSRYAWDFVLYGIALVGLYAVSSAYHLLPIGALARHWLRRADHACIYAYMACAFTPFSLSLAPGPFGLALVATAWACAVVGVLAKLVHFERTRRLGGALYMVVGWVPAATLPYAFRHLGAGQVMLLLLMGALYMAGAGVLFLRRPDPRPKVFGYHEVWHSLVLLAMTCYYFVLLALAGT